MSHINKIKELEEKLKEETAKVKKLEMELQRRKNANGENSPASKFFSALHRMAWNGYNKD